MANGIKWVFFSFPHLSTDFKTAAACSLLGKKELKKRGQLLRPSIRAGRAKKGQEKGLEQKGGPKRGQTLELKIGLSRADK